MYGGHVVETAPVATIYEHAEHPYTRALLESVPELESAGRSVRRPGIPGSPPELTEALPGCVFAPRCAHARPGCDAVPMTLEPVAPGHRTACAVRPFAAGAATRTGAQA
jgi:oligopeptide/dipeptide ABC transporter ATP-binding protein